MRLVSAAMCALLLSLTLAAGCVVHVRARATLVADTEPPPPKVMVRPVDRPGYVYVQGRWELRGGRWEWQDGRWQRARAGYAWRDGRWERAGNRYRWIEGGWETAATTRAGGDAIDTPIERDHRAR